MDNCCMSNCENNSENSVEAFYSFPTDFKMCMLWVQQCGKAEFFEDFSYMGALPFIGRKICTAHFQMDAFNDPSDKYSGLKSNSTPIPNLVTELVQIKEEEQTEVQLDPLEIKQELVNENVEDDNSNLSDEQEMVKPLLLISEEETTVSPKLDQRRKRNALRAALKRQAESPEQRADRKLKDIIRSAKRRQSETELQRQIRRYNDAVRAAYRRSNETEEQRQRRRMVDILRAARRRQSETDEQRTARLKADRERAARRRMLKKITESGSELSSDSFTSNAMIVPDNFRIIEPQVNLTENVVHHFASISNEVETLNMDEFHEENSLSVSAEELVS